MSAVSLLAALESVRQTSVWPLIAKCRTRARCHLCLSTLAGMVDLYVVLAANVAEECCFMLVSYANHYRKLKSTLTLQAEVIEKAEKLKGAPSQSKISGTMTDLEVKFEVKLKQ